MNYFFFVSCLEQKKSQSRDIIKQWLEANKQCENKKKTICQCCVMCPHFLSVSICHMTTLWEIYLSVCTSNRSMIKQTKIFGCETVKKEKKKIFLIENIRKKNMKTNNKIMELRFFWKTICIEHSWNNEKGRKFWKSTNTSETNMFAWFWKISTSKNKLQVQRFLN